MQLGNAPTTACIVQAMQQRSQQNGIARVRWERLPSCQLVAVASGTAEAASNAETSVTQLVQAFNIRAQVVALVVAKSNTQEVALLIVTV